MLLANTIFESFLAKYSIWLCSGFSVAQNGHFLRRGASTIWFVHHFVPLLPRLRIFLDQLRLAVPPRGGVSSSTTCSVAVIEGHQPKLWSRDFKSAPATYRSHRSSLSWSTPFMLAILRPQLRTCCVRSANVGCWDSHVARARPYQQN